jgi:alcohol dehydrogenase YqhD (iron-dependent ADH family)
MNISDDRLEEMAHKCTGGNCYTVGNFVKLDKSDVLKILRTAL